MATLSGGVVDIKRRIGELEDDKPKDRRIVREVDEQRDLVFRLCVITLSTILRTSGDLWRRASPAAR
jgi:hypothetical protein